MLWFLRALTLLLLLSSFTIAAAQDDECKFAVPDLAFAVRDAQEAYDNGDPAEAAAALDAAQALLDDFRARCVDTLTPSAFALTETYRAPGGIFTLRYPEGWQSIDGDNDLAAFGESSLDLEALSDDPSDIAPGELLLVAQVIPGQENAEQTASEFAEDVRDGNNSIFSSVELINPAPTNALPAIRLEVASDDIAASLDVVDLGASQSGEDFQVLLLGVVAVADEAAQARALLDAVSATLRGAETAAPTLAPVTVASAPGIGYDDIAFSTTQSLQDMDISPRGVVALSPDGTRLAYLETDELCIRNLASTDEDCFPTPEGYRPLTLDWSPDGRYIAGTADFYRLLREPDVILFDTERGQFTNLTDDGTTRIRMDDVSQGTLIDIGVSWSPDSQSMYLYRHIPFGTDGLRGQHGIYRLPLDGSEAELIVDLTPTLGTLPYVYFATNPSLDGMMPLSPDGTRLAFAVYAPGDDSGLNGVWVYNLETDDLDPVVPLERLLAETGSEHASARGSTPTGMSWAADGGLYIHTTNNAHLSFSLTHFDLTNRTLTLLSEPATESSGRGGIAQNTPLFAAPLPNRDGVVYAAMVDEEVRIVKARVVDGAAQSEVILTFEDRTIVVGQVSDVGADGTMLLGGLLLLP
jgi:hypothetical protein